MIVRSATCTRNQSRPAALSQGVAGAGNGAPHHPSALAHRWVHGGGGGGRGGVAGRPQPAMQRGSLTTAGTLSAWARARNAVSTLSVAGMGVVVSSSLDLAS